MDETSLDISQIQWVQPLWLITSSVVTIITLIRAVYLSQLHYRLDHPKSHCFDQKGKLQLWVVISLHSSEMISLDLFVSFLPSFLPVNYFVTSNLSNLKNFVGYVFG